mgnify:FL=1
MLVKWFFAIYKLFANMKYLSVYGCCSDFSCLNYQCDEKVIIDMNEAAYLLVELSCYSITNSSEMELL